MLHCWENFIPFLCKQTMKFTDSTDFGHIQSSPFEKQPKPWWCLCLVLLLKVINFRYVHYFGKTLVPFQVHLCLKVMFVLMLETQLLVNTSVRGCMTMPISRAPHRLKTKWASQQDERSLPYPICISFQCVSSRNCSFASGENHFCDRKTHRFVQHLNPWNSSRGSHNGGRTAYVLHTPARTPI